MSHQRIYRPKSATPKTPISSQPSSLTSSLPNDVLHLQRLVGNRQVLRMAQQQRLAIQSAPNRRLQRAKLRVLKVDVLKSGDVDKDVDMAALNTQLTKITNTTHRQAVKTVLDGLSDAAPLTEKDLPSLAHAIVQQSTVPALNQAATEQQLVTALQLSVPTSLTNDQPKSETAFFDFLLTRAASTSVAKGTPNTLSIANLAGGGSQYKDYMQTAITTVDTVKGQINTFNTGLFATTTEDFQVYPADTSFMDVLYNLFASQINEVRADMLRDIHGSAAGWLPDKIDTANTADQFITAAKAAINQRLPHPQTYDTLPPKRKREVIRQYWQSRPTAEKRKIMWLSYPISTGIDSNYIEVNTTGSGMTGVRLVYDFANNDFYFTLHYNWHKGYNPFFKLI